LADDTVRAYTDAQLEEMSKDGKSYDEVLKYVKRYGMHRHFDISR
jgi:hypothetical protein